MRGNFAALTVSLILLLYAGLPSAANAQAASALQSGQTGPAAQPARAAWHEASRMVTAVDHGAVRAEIAQENGLVRVALLNDRIERGGPCAGWGFFWGRARPRRRRYLYTGSYHKPPNLLNQRAFSSVQNGDLPIRCNCCRLRAALRNC